MDSVLRVTSATASDGRLAALALYPLGAAARAAETAAARPLLPPASASPATTVDASGAVESPASANQAREVHVQETEEARPSSSSFGGVHADTADSSGATTAPAAPELTRLPSASGERLEPEDGGMPAECANEGEGGGGDGGGRCSGLEGVVEETTAVAGKGRWDIGRPAPATLPLSERGDDMSVSLRVGRENGDGDDTHEVDVMAHPSNAKFEEEDGGSEVGTVQYARDTVGSEGEIHASSAVAAAAAPAPAAASTASAPPSPAPAATSAAAAASAVFAFDVEGLKRDLRFEQLVEIVECVPLELSVSDISKVSCAIDSCHQSCIHVCFVINKSSFILFSLPTIRSLFSLSVRAAGENCVGLGSSLVSLHCNIRTRSDCVPPSSGSKINMSLEFKHFTTRFLRVILHIRSPARPPPARFTPRAGGLGSTHPRQPPPQQLPQISRPFVHRSPAQRVRIRSPLASRRCCAQQPSSGRG